MFSRQWQLEWKRCSSLLCCSLNSAATTDYTNSPFIKSVYDLKALRQQLWRQTILCVGRTVHACHVIQSRGQTATLWCRSLYLFVGSGSDFSLASTLIHRTFLLTPTGHFKSVCVMRRVWLFYFVEIFFSYSRFCTMPFDFYLN